GGVAARPRGGRHAAVRHRRAARVGHERRQEHVPEPRLVLGGVVSPDGCADLDVHAAVRHRTHQRLGRTRHRAASRRQDHPSERTLPRSREPAVRAARREAMMSHDAKSARRPDPDPELAAIADYALSYHIESAAAYETAYYCLMDTLACGFQALQYPACTKLLGPVVPGATMP